MGRGRPSGVAVHGAVHLWLGAALAGGHAGGPGRRCPCRLPVRRLRGRGISRGLGPRRFPGAGPGGALWPERGRTPTPATALRRQPAGAGGAAGARRGLDRPSDHPALHPARPTPPGAPHRPHRRRPDTDTGPRRRSGAAARRAGGDPHRAGAAPAARRRVAGGAGLRRLRRGAGLRGDRVRSPGRQTGRAGRDPGAPGDALRLHRRGRLPRNHRGGGAHP